MTFRNATRSLLISSSFSSAAARHLLVPPRRAVLRRWSHDKAPPAGLRLPLCSHDDDSEVLKSEQRVAQTTNAFMSDATNIGWHVLDRKVNSYPMIRKFIAIGTGGDDFVQAMVIAVESVLQQSIPEGWITQKLSSKGNYVSVNIGPIRVISSEQVQAVYNAMRKDNRMKYFF